MRIALIHNQFIRAGGMERYLFDLVNGFADAGHDVTVICYKVDAPPLLSDKCQTIRYDYALVPKPLRRYAFDRSVRKTLREHKFDLTIALPEIQNVDIAICGGTHRAYLSYLNLNPSQLDKAQIRLETKSYSTATTTVAHSPMLKEELEHLYQLPESQVKVIFPPTDTKTFHIASEPERSNYRKQYGIHENKTTILLCSTGHQRKGLVPLLVALTLLPSDQYELLIAGRQVDELSKPSAPKNARALGYVTNMAELYNAVDITALPALYEPFGLVAIESLQCGAPVILSSAVGAGALVSKEDGIILEQVTPQTIAGALANLRRHPRTVTPDFAATHGLALPDHIQALLNLHKQKNIR